MTPADVHEELNLAFTFGTPDTYKTFSHALSSLAILVSDEAVEASGAWFDYGHVAEYSGDEAEVAVHARLITSSGVITLDHEFSFDGAPDARFIPWSRVRELRIIAMRLNQPLLRNMWLETDSGRIEFAGVASHDALLKCATAVRRYLA